MKHNFLLFALCLWTLISFSQQLSKPQLLTQRDYFTNPLVSPKADYALITGQNFKGVYLLNLKTREITTITLSEGSGYGYSWDYKGQMVYYREHTDHEYVMNSHTMVYDIAQKSAKKIDLNHNYLPSYQGNNPDNSIVVYTNIQTLKIEAIDLNTLKKWVVTPEEGQFYNAVLSHDKTKVAVHNGATIYIYAIDGKEKGRKIGMGLATAWSPKDDFLLGFLDQSKDGHEISNSDLYLFDVNKATTQKITNTPDAYEMFPCFYGDDAILYADDKSGAIVTSKIKF